MRRLLVLAASVAAALAAACSGPTESKAPKPTVTLTASPDSVAAGQFSLLTWTSTNATGCQAGGGWTGAKTTNGSQSVAPDSTTSYTLACTGAGGTAGQSATVTVVPAPTLTFTANPTTIASGQSSTLTWSSTNATSCAASGGWTGAKATSGSQGVSPTSTTIYTLICTGIGGSDTASATVTISTTPAPPTVTLTANPTTIASGQSSMLTWSTTNAAACTASGGWSGTKATSGSQSVSPTSTTTYTLTCTGTGGSDSASATVTIATPVPIVTLTATPTTITSGQSSTLAWSTTNATSCTASGGWSGAKATSGSQSVSPTSTTTYTLSCTGPGGSGSQSATVTVNASPPPGSYVYPLAVGPTGRYLVDQNGKPFLLVGDAAWSLIAQQTDTAADTYLADRQQRGFSAILVNLIEHLFSDSAPADIYGIQPFTGATFATPNDAYFAHVDHIIQSAAQKGILVLLAPTYVGFGCGDQGWAAEMESATDSAMTTWGQYLGNRYAGFNNILWVIGGDADPTACSPSVKGKLQDVVNGIRQYDTRHPFTAHNMRTQMAIAPWSGASWLNVNDTYTDGLEYTYAQTAYAVSPSLPFFLIEAVYENEGADAAQLRAQSYWTVLSGGFGHVFGACPIWGFGAQPAASDCGTSNWRGALGSQGSQNMTHFGKLFTGRHWYSLVPDLAHTVLTSGYGSPGGGDYVTAAYAADSSSIIAFLPFGGTVTVSGSRLRDTTMTAWWVNPATGAATLIGTVSSRTPQSFTAPGGGSSDYVLVIDSPSFGFGTPGG
ncbi:MAG TPA: DUF4038 domain-containing protein [Gemmatimonadales bacterium]|nr:DUF4038 domain-containing protein [Gemmatimonadales bacterium]